MKTERSYCVAFVISWCVLIAITLYNVTISCQSIRLSYGGDPRVLPLTSSRYRPLEEKKLLVNGDEVVIRCVKHPFGAWLYGWPDQVVEPTGGPSLISESGEYVVRWADITINGKSCNVFGRANIATGRFHWRMEEQDAVWVEDLPKPKPKPKPTPGSQSGVEPNWATIIPPCREGGSRVVAR